MANNNTYHRRFLTTDERFWQRVEGYPDPSRCWLWQGFLDQDGYGTFWIGSRTDGSRRAIRAHRFAYGLLKGTVPEGVADHLCKTRNCVNPDHLEFVTNAENLLRGAGIQAENKRKTHCHRGHPLEGSNLYLARKGHLTERHCRECRRIWMAERRAQLKAPH